MGADTTGPFFQGIAIQHPRITAAAIDETLTTISQAAPIPGDPAHQQDTDGVLEAVGTQSAEKKLRIRTLRSGHPGTDEASFVWRYAGESLWHGWDPPYVCFDWEFAARSVTANKYKLPHGVETAPGALCVVVQEDNQKVTAFTRSATGTWSAAITIYDKGSTYTDGAYPCILKLRSGRLLCFFWRPLGTLATIRAHYSDDDGTTWRLYQEDVLGGAQHISTSTYTLARIRAALLDDQILLVVGVEQSSSPKQQLWQYASGDLGATFAQISTLTTGNSRTRPDIAVVKERIVVAYISYRTSPPGSGANAVPYVRILGSVYESLSAATATVATDSDSNSMEWGTYAADLFSSAECAIWVDEDDSLYIVGLDHDAAGGALREMMLSRSADLGITWGSVGDSAAPGDGASVWRGHLATIYPYDFAAVPFRSMVALFHRGESGEVQIHDDSLMCAWLGGHSRVCMPEYGVLATDLANRASWEATWWPLVDPSDMPFIGGIVTTGTPTIGRDADGRVVAHGAAADSAYWPVTPTYITNGFTTGAIFLLTVKITVNNALTVYLRAQITDGTDAYNVEVRVSGTTAELFNNGVSVGSIATTVFQGTGGQVLLAVGGSSSQGEASAWVRPRWDTHRDWSLVATSTALTKLSGTTTKVFRFGTIAGPTTGTATFRQYAHTSSTYTATQFYGGQVNPTDLLGRTHNATPVYVDDGLSVYLSDGPTVNFDEWHLDSRYDYPAEAVVPTRHPSPRRVHRTIDDDTNALKPSAVGGGGSPEITWLIGASTSDDHGLLAPLLTVYLGNINWRTGSLWGRQASTWVKLADIDSSSGTSGLKYIREGALVRPDLTGGSAANRYLPAHILAGCYWDGGGPGNDPVDLPRRILTNSDGAWTPTASGPTLPTTLQLESYNTADATAGSSGRILSDELVLLIPLSPGTKYNAIKLRIDAQDTAEGYLRTGVALIGITTPFGEPMTVGRGFGADFRSEVTEGFSGARIVRSRTHPRPFVEFDWTGGIWTAPIAGNPATPDFRRAYTPTGPVVAARGASPYTARGLLDRLNGAAEPCLFLARWPIPSSSSPITITNKALFLYGRVASESSRLDVAQGQEWDPDYGEVIRVNTVRIEGEL